MSSVWGEWLDSTPVQLVYESFESRDYLIYAVGGAVRDDLLGRDVSDVDFATNARPDQIIALAQNAGLKAIPTGIDHGTITLVAGDQAFEVTTFRKDIETDGRRAVIEFADDLETDAARRDFTINGLYACRDGTVVDPVGGLPDIEARRIRFIGDARLRIREDALRILRYFRFLATIDGADAHPDETALSACQELAKTIDSLSAERITAEMQRLLGAPNPGPAITRMTTTGVLAHVLPNADTASLDQLLTIEADHAPRWIRRLSALSSDHSRLRLPNKAQKALTAITRAQAASAPIAQSAYRFGERAALDAALLNGQTPDKQQAAHGASQTLPVSAADLMPPFHPGPKLGQALKALEETWITSNFQTPKDALIAQANRFLDD